MSKKAKFSMSMFPGDFLMKNSIILELDEWQEFKKKNMWRKLYKNQAFKIGVIDSFCASIAHCSDSIWSTGGTQEERRIKYLRLLTEGETQAILFCSTGIELVDGWKLHKNWFRGMIAQLVLVGGSNREEKAERYEMLDALFTEVGWNNLQESINPKYDDITSIHNIPFMYKNAIGIEVEHHYQVLVEPTAPIPTGSKWVSKRGRVWKCGMPRDGGFTFDFRSNSHEDGSADVDRSMVLTDCQIFGMRRIA